MAEAKDDEKESVVRQRWICELFGGPRDGESIEFINQRPPRLLKLFWRHRHARYRRVFHDGGTLFYLSEDADDFTREPESDHRLPEEPA
jgi:hypothetical protein